MRLGDARIAATAIENGFNLLSNDKDFLNIKRLAVIAPFNFK